MPTEPWSVCVGLMRRQRHDFLNHLQVLWGLLQLNEPARALAYVRDTLQEMERAEGILHLKYPRLALSLMHKVIAAEEQEIEVRLSGETDLEGLAVAEEELVQLVDALWQACVAYLGELPWENRYLEVRLQETAAEYAITLALNQGGKKSRPYWEQALGPWREAARRLNGELGWSEDQERWLVELRWDRTGQN